MPDALSNTFSALADPTRRAILARLALGETSVTELAEPFKMSMPAVSKHLKVLERAGLISRGREAQWRPCRIEPAALKNIDEWLRDYPAIAQSRGGVAPPGAQPCHKHTAAKRRRKPETKTKQRRAPPPRHDFTFHI